MAEREAGLRARFVVNGVSDGRPHPLKDRPRGVDTRVVHTIDPRDQSGFTIVEVLVAAVVLVAGALAAFSLIDGANKTISINSARIGATNLARELTEYARGTSYESLQPSQIEGALRQRPGIAGSGSPWTVERRGVRYAISTSVCTFDDPKDGLSATPPANPCPAAAPIADAPTERNPDDFRRVTFTLSWTARAKQGSMTQTALIVNPTGGRGPRVISLPEPPQDVTGDVTFDPVTSEHAAALHWTVDDGVSGGDATGGPTGWSFTWTLGTPLVEPWVRDGTYFMQAQAFDSRGVPGEARLVPVHVNRHRPFAVEGFEGGYNARFSPGVVDLRWGPYGERDVVGYRVYRQSDGKLICPALGGEPTRGTHCTDRNPPNTIPIETYTVVAVDCLVLKAPSCDYEDGLPAAVPVTLSTTAAAPDPPTNVQATVEDGLPKLTWTPSDDDPVKILFYRIYRGIDSGFDGRYDTTVTAEATYTDPSPGATTQHRYWVTAVDQHFNESVASPPVDSPPVTS